MNKHPKMSIVIPCYNGAAVIGRALKSLLAQNYPRDRFEIIVVDDGSTDGTAAVVKQYDVIYVHHPHNRGIAAGRNSGLAAATGDIYIGFDDDGVADPDWLSNLAAAYSHPGVAGIGSILDHPHNLRGLTDRYMAATGSGNPPQITMNAANSPLARLKSYVISQVKPFRFRGTKLIPVSRIFGATASFPIEILRAVSGWDESMSGHKFGGVEDTDLCHRIQTAYPDLGFYAAPQAVLVHDPKMSFKALIRRSFVRGPQNLAYYRQNHLIPPIFPGPIGWVAAVLLALLAGPVPAAATAILAPLALYFWWPVRGLLERRPDYLANAYLQLCEEAAATAGLGLGYFKLFREAFNARPKAEDAFQSGLEMFRTDSLFRNATFLMASTAIMAVLGFVFWIFIAHLYTPTQIGEASALISITLLISNLSFLGLNSGFVRFLPTSRQPSRDINAGLITVAAATIVATAIYLVVGDGFKGSLAFFTTNPGGRALFVILMVAVSLNTLTDSVFIANRRAGFHTIVYTTFGILKLLLPLGLISLGALGIFTAYVAAAVVSLLLSLIFMRQGIGYRFWSSPRWQFIRSSRRYASNNYFAIILAGLPSQLMPTIIIERIGSPQAAYFSMAWTMANLLYVVPSAITNSLLAETSHDMQRQSANVRKAALIMTTILVPAVLLAIVVAPYLLKLFGPQYSAGGTLVFQILALCTFLVAANSIGNTIFNLEHRSSSVMVVQGVIAVVMLGLSYVLTPFGLAGIGIAMLAGNAAGTITQAILFRLRRRTIIDATSLPTAGIIRRALQDYQSLSDAKIGLELGGGHLSSTVLVSTHDQQYVLKLYHPDKRTLADLKSEIGFTNFLANRGIPVPHFVANAKRQLIGEVTDGDTTWLCLLMNLEPGGHPSRYSPALLSNMAQLQGRIHLSGLEYAMDHRPRGKKPRAGQPSRKAALIAYTPKGLSHFDFERSNILTEGDQVTCVLDFEGMRYDPLVVCVYFTLTTLYEASPDPLQLEHYLRAYNSIRPLTLIERPILRAALAWHFRSPRLLMLQF